MTSITTPPNLVSRAFFGLRTDIQFNAHFISDSEILYPAGTVLVIHNFLLKKQRFIKMTDRQRTIKSIHLSPNRQYLALNEIGTDELKPSITLYDLNTCKRKKILTIPHDFVSLAKEFATMSFTYDSKYIVAITGEPDYDLYYYNWDRGKVESHAKAQNPTGLGSVNAVYCNPADNTLVVITGPGTFRIMNVSETVWRQWGWCKADNMDITACMWLTADRIMFGTSQGVLMMVENGEIRNFATFKAMEVNEMLLKKAHLAEDEEEEGGGGEVPEEGVPKQDSTSILEADINAAPVTNLVNFYKGFAYCCGPGYVHMFEKENIQFYRRRNLYRVARESYKHTRDFPYWSEMDDIQHMIIDPEETSLVITTWRRQLYKINLFGPHIMQESVIYFKEMGPPMHTGKIKCLATCSWKPIFMTAGVDRTVRLWNYFTDEVEFIKIYAEDVHSVALHPTGLFAILGFADKLRYMVVYIDNLESLREFSIRSCTRIAFSNNGHMFAAANAKLIQVFSTVSFLNVYNLKGHGGDVTALSWSALDTVLVSCGTAGAVYEWDVSIGQRVNEAILKTNVFKACCVTGSGKQTYAIGTDGELKEISNSLIRRSMPIHNMPIDNMLLSRSDLMIFLTGGTEVTGIQLPLLDKVVMADFHMHSATITGITLSYDDQTLISVAEDSSICIWKLTNPEGRAVQLEKEFVHSNEVLISKKDLQDKIDKMHLLATRMSEMETESAYHLKQTEAAHVAKLKEVHELYGVAIQELKEKNESLENEHTYELGSIHQDITKLRAEHDKTLNQTEAEFNQRLINEFDKYQHLEDKTNRMRIDYENRLQQLEESKEQALKNLHEKYNRIIEGKDVNIAELQEAQEAEEREHEIIKSAIEDDADRELVEIRQKYEAELKHERDQNVRLKGEANVVKKKLIAAAKDMDEFRHQILQLKAEQNQLNTVIASLEIDVSNLKKEISERDNTLKEKEKRIQELKKKNHELEKYKFVLTFKIDELKAQIEPLDRDIRKKKLRTIELEDSLEILLKKRARYELKILRLNEKLLAGKQEMQVEIERSLALKHVLKKIKIDLHNMSGNTTDFVKMKQDIKYLYHKYIDDPDWKKVRSAEEEAVMEFNRQRQHLETQIAHLKGLLAKATSGNRGDAARLIDENCTLLCEINKLRGELNNYRAKNNEADALLGIGRQHLPPIVARQKLKDATETREKIEETHNAQLAARDDQITALKEENEVLIARIRCMQATLNVPERDYFPPPCSCGRKQGEPCYCGDTNPDRCDCGLIPCTCSQESGPIQPIG